MEGWRKVWREGFAPVLSTESLEALADALERDDRRLTQGSTTTPPPLMCVQDWPCEGACALGYCGWHGEGLQSVGEVEEFFAKCCFEADRRLGEPAACRWFLNWFDDTPPRRHAEPVAGRGGTRAEPANGRGSLGKDGYDLRRVHGNRGVR